MLYLVPRQPEQATVSILKAALARALSGRVAGVSLTLMEPGGHEDHVCTGPYKDRPAEAVRAAMRASMILTHLEEERRGKP